MKRTITRLAAAAAFAFPLVAPAAADTWVRWDGVRFDSDVGAFCGALNTDILFMPDEVTLDIHDESPLDFLAECFTRGELAGATIGVVAPWDGTDYDLNHAHARQLAVISYLIDKGVDPSQLTTWRVDSDQAAWEPGRVQFRVVDGANFILGSRR